MCLHIVAGRGIYVDDCCETVYESDVMDVIPYQPIYTVGHKKVYPFSLDITLLIHYRFLHFLYPFKQE